MTKKPTTRRKATTFKRAGKLSAYALATLRSKLGLPVMTTKAAVR